MYSNIISHIHLEPGGGQHSTQQGPCQGGTRGQREQLETRRQVWSTKGCGHLSYCTRLWGNWKPLLKDKQALCLVFLIRKVVWLGDPICQSRVGRGTYGYSIWGPFGFTRFRRWQMLLDLSFRLCITSPKLPSPSFQFTEKEPWEGSNWVFSLGAVVWKPSQGNKQEAVRVYLSWISLYWVT